MKWFAKHIVFGCFISIGFAACDGTDVTFTEPQPSGVKEVLKFKRKFTGDYLSISDSSVLHISKSAITQIWDFEIEVDSNHSIQDATNNISVNTDEGDLQIQASEDSTNYRVHYSHEVFTVSNEMVLKYVDHTYFLNFQEDTDSWDVKTVYFDTDGFLQIHDLNLSPADLEKLKSITSVSEETDTEGKVVDYHIQPTKKELSQIMNSNLFEDGEKFVRIRK
tara:strand:- start:95233 stop:95895 length:663 start_codon:yes stop_codon:yes gene_type:complete